MILMSFDLHKSVKCYIYDAIESMRHRKKNPSEVHIILHLKQVDQNSLKVLSNIIRNQKVFLHYLWAAWFFVCKCFSVSENLDQS